MKHEPTAWLDRSASYADERGVGARAGVFLLDGAYQVANHASRAERRLLERGALLVATLVFDLRQAERAVSGGAPSPYAFAGPPVPLLLPFRPRQAASGAARAASRN